MNDPHALCEQVAAELLARGAQLATAESCTGGLLAAACTAQAGASLWFERGFVTYSNAAKTELLGVPAEWIAQQGAVSEAVAQAMAAGAAQHARTAVAVAVTGIAGPTGGSASKPVGLVWFGFQVGRQLSSEARHFAGDRAAVRNAATAHALARLLALLRTAPAEAFTGAA